MAPFQILSAERGFFAWFEKGAATARDSARLLLNLFEDFCDVDTRVLQTTELEHQGDCIVHEMLNLLSRTFITPLEGDEIRALDDGGGGRLGSEPVDRLQVHDLVARRPDDAPAAGEQQATGRWSRRARDHAAARRLLLRVLPPCGRVRSSGRLCGR